MQTLPELRSAVPTPQQSPETGLVPTRLITSAEGVFMAGNVPVVSGPAGAINPTDVAPIRPPTEYLTGEVVEGSTPGANDDTVEFNRRLYLPTTDLAPWAGRDKQPSVVWGPGKRIGDEPAGAWIDPTKDNVQLIMAAWPQRVMRRLDKMRRHGMLPPSLDAARDTELEQMHSVADTTLADTRRAVIEAMNDTDEHGILPLARLAGAAVVRNHAELQHMPAPADEHPASEEPLPGDITSDPNWAGHTALHPIVELEPANEAAPTEVPLLPQIAQPETRDPASDTALTTAESAAVEAAAKGETLPPETLAALLAEPSAPRTAAPRDTGESTRAITWAPQGGDGAAGSWMMPVREPAATLPAETAHDEYVSVMADIAIPDGVKQAFAEQQPMSPAEFDERMRELNSKRIFLEDALRKGEIAPENVADARAQLTLVMQQESELVAKGTGGGAGADNSLETMQRVLMGLRKI